MRRQIKLIQKQHELPQAVPIGARKLSRLTEGMTPVLRKEAQKICARRECLPLRILHPVEQPTDCISRKWRLLSSQPVVGSSRKSKEAMRRHAMQKNLGRRRAPAGSTIRRSENSPTPKVISGQTPNRKLTADVVNVLLFSD